jgi:ribonuclease D
MAQLFPVADTTHTYVACDDAVRDLLDWIAPAQRVAMDIEADGLFHYYQKVCLAQLTVRGRNFIIDTLAGADLAPLWAALADKVLLFHSADYDLRMLRSSCGFRPRAGLVDTMIAAQLLGREKLGLATLVEEFAGQPFSKVGQKSDWSHRPLSPAQLLYAVDDTRYLEPLADLLASELDRLGRRGWFAESCAAAVDATETDRQAESPENWRVKGVWDLTPHQAAIMRELWLWREDEARRADLPPFKVIGNEMLMALAVWAQAHPRAPLAEGPRLPRHFVGRRLETLRDTVNRAVALEASEWPEPRLRRNEQKPEPGPGFEKLRHEVAQLAQSLNVPASVVAPRLAMEEISRRRPTDVAGIRAVGHLLQWQAELIAPLVARTIGGGK